MTIFNSNHHQQESSQEENLRNTVDSQLEPRILIVDDNEAIHSDFNKILGVQNSDSDSFKDARAAFFGANETQDDCIQEFNYQIDSAYQGKQALEMVVDSLEQKYPYTLAFVDMRMPPGWDGLETVQKIWEKDPEIQVVFCSAYSDHSWEQYHKLLSHTDRFLILKKPFDHLEVKQLAVSLTKRWQIIQSLTGNKIGLPISQAITSSTEVSEQEFVSTESSRGHLNSTPSDKIDSDVTLEELIAPLKFLSEHLMSSMNILEELDSLKECCADVVSTNAQHSEAFIDQLKSLNPESLIDSLKHSIQGSVIGLHKIQQVMDGLQSSDSGQYRQDLDTVKSI